MKLMIASDIHGSAYYCDLLLQRFHEEQADRLLLLGDILYHGPRNSLPKDYDTKKVFEMLNREKNRLLAIRGNCDSDVDQMVLEFPIMADHALLVVDGINIYATHGHIYNEDNPPPLEEQDVLVYGHTHVPASSIESGCLCINPGSVSLPKENTPHSYLILDNRNFQWKNLVTGEIFGECKIKELTVE